MAIEEFKGPRSPGIDQIPAKLMKVWSRTICSEIHKLINSVWNKEEMLKEWKELIIGPIHKESDKTYCNNYRGTSVLPNYIQNFIQHPAVKVNPICRGCYWGSSENTMEQCISYL
jgi:hypothetical protein